MPDKLNMRLHNVKLCIKTADTPPIDPPQPPANDDRPVNENATDQTVNLYRKLKEAQGANIYWGQEDVYWCIFTGVRRPVYKIIGADPMVHAVDIKNLWMPGGGVDRYLPDMLEHYRRGGMLSVMGGLFHEQSTMLKKMQNPSAGMLPGGPLRNQWLAEIDRVASFLKMLVDDQGRAIPVMYRPLHEMDGDWTWCGWDRDRPQDYRALYRDLYDQMKLRGLNNLLWIFCAGWYAWPDRDPMQLYYPGDDVVDIIGLDRYTSFPGGVVDSLKHRQQYYQQSYLAARKHKKIYCITEGFRNGKHVYSQLPEKILRHEWTRHTVYPLLDAGIWPAGIWTWWSPDYGPMPGRGDAQSFLEMSQHPAIKFLE